MSTPTVTSDPREAVTELLAEESADGSLQIQERIALCRECLRGVVAVAEDWATLSANGKGCPGNSSVLAEEMLSGPAVVARQLWLTIQTLQNVERHQSPILPGRPFLRDDGRTVVPVFPARGVFDTVTFSGLRATLQMQPQVTEADLHGATLQQTRAGVITGLTAVLGAGNVSSIPATDSLNRIMFECRRVVLKLNPVNEYLRPVFADAFASLIRRRLLRIVTGDGQVGQSLVHDDRVTDVHITGSVDTHNAIVWGTTPEERHQRQQNNDPLVQKAVTSELGNVTPWIVAPGRYSERQLRSQATHVAASITNNAAFNCLATRVILTWNRWDQRDQFLALLKQRLTDTPTRPAYYPGAVDRFRRFSGLDIEPDQNNHLPWTLLERQSIEDRPELFTEESFACVCAETALAADTPEHFLQAAAAFANDRMHGTLCCSVTLPDDLRRSSPTGTEECLRQLRYGSVCVNQWSGLAYGLTSPPWGAYPGATLQNVESGIGSVHNIYLLENFEKTILSGPLINFPKPVWFPSHRNALQVARGLLRLYESPSVFRLPLVGLAAMTG